MPRLKWHPDRTPRLFFADDLLEVRRNELRRFVARDSIAIGSVRYAPEDVPGAQRPDFDDSAWTIIEPGQPLATRNDQLVWLRAQVTVPPSLAGKPLALQFGAVDADRPGGPRVPEAMLFVNGEPYHGLDNNHALVPLPETLCTAGAFSIAIQAWSGRNVLGQLRFQPPQLIWFDAETDALVFDFDTIWRTLQVVDRNSEAYVTLLKLGERAVQAIDWTHPRSDAFYGSVAEARAISSEGLAALEGQERLKPTVNAIGHTHLDVAWLWTLANIKLKTARTWATQLRLMERYPEFKWIQSQPQLYKFVKETQPELWEQVKRRVAEGRWEADGGMWVEADCNVTGGESLIRQFLHGLRFFREEFGVENVVLWLPDVFGYAWALPQIIRGCGLKYFMTTKISWSQFNHFPYDTFLWRGLDGTEVLSHFVTTPSPGQEAENWITTYNGMILPETIKGTWDRHQQKEVTDEVLTSFGYGDGGGGPMRESLEYARRLADVPGIPRLRIGRVDEFFARLDERARQSPHLPVWYGELYLEYHRGTYTSQAQQKRKNRKAEFLLHNAELYAATAGQLAHAAYPKAAFDEAWELLLRNQFHDIIPGTSIPEVYEDSARDYARVFALGQAALDAATDTLARATDLREESLVVFNPTGMARSDYVEVDLPDNRLPVDDAGRPLAAQGRLIYAEDVPANGYRAFALRAAPPGDVAPAMTVTERLIETELYRIEFDAHGHIGRLYDKEHDRDVLQPGRTGNVLQVFEDKPLRWDAWDIDIFYQQKGHDVTDLREVVVEETGPERGVLRCVWHYEGCTFTQRMIVYGRHRRIDFETRVDWQLSQVLCKVAFPVDVHSARATYEIQFGNVERPTHWNTSWDWARFETCAHKWVDLSEGDYGVALLNDCKYGHDVKDGVLRLTLIKSGTQPDPHADRGEHRFTYSLLPHAGDWYEGGVVEHGYRLNNPLMAVHQPAHAGRLPATFGIVSCSAPNVVVETVKQAEAGDGVVVRVYEYGNRRGPAELRFGRPVRSAMETNLIEADGRPVPFAGERVTFAIKPYEIKTFVVQLG